MESFVEKVEALSLEVEPFHRNVERYAQKVEHAHFIRQFTGECRIFRDESRTSLPGNRTFSP